MYRLADLLTRIAEPKPLLWGLSSNELLHCKRAILCILYFPDNFLLAALAVLYICVKAKLKCEGHGWTMGWKGSYGSGVAHVRLH
jgi:hypothetical protein